jgi:putative methionine-R-sulfoxide reductase with GAF domain
VEISKVLYSTLDLGELFEIILEIATEHTAAERASLFLLDAERGELWTLVAQGMAKTEIRIPSGTGLAGWVAASGETLSITDAYADPRFDPGVDRASGYRTRNLLVAAVKDREGRVVGVLQILNKPNGPFTPDDVEFVEGISVHAAIALDNARLHRDSRSAGDWSAMALARTIQRSLLPRRPGHRGFEIAVRHETSFTSAGLLRLHRALGHGTCSWWPTWRKAAAAALVISTWATRCHPGQARALHRGSSSTSTNGSWRARGAQYMTLFLGLLDLPRRALHYINAGHVAPFLIRPEGPVPLREGGMVVGLLPSARYKRGCVLLRSGDVVPVHDGITEAGSRRIAVRRGQAGGAGWLIASARRAVVDAIFGTFRLRAADPRGRQGVIAIKVRERVDKVAPSSVRKRQRQPERATSGNSPQRFTTRPISPLEGGFSPRPGGASRG